MRPESLRTMLLTLAIAVVATGCGGSAGTKDSSVRQAAGAQSAMSNKGLANLSLAQNYLGAGKLDYALDRANRALRTDPNSADVQLVLGMIRERLGDDSRAAEHYARAVKLGPDSGHILNVQAAWLCRKGSYAEAEVLFARAVKDPFYKQREQAYFNAGKCAMQASKLDLASRYLREGLESSPKNPALLALMAELQFARGDFMSARAFYQRREAVGEPSADLLDLAARIEQGAGDTVAAQRYRQRLRDAYPDYTPSAPESLRQP